MSVCESVCVCVASLPLPPLIDLDARDGEYRRQEKRYASLQEKRQAKVRLWTCLVYCSNDLFSNKILQPRQ